MRAQPVVSVVTPVYNGEAFLAECIESVLKQTYDNYEYIIVNNCSTDRSLTIALEYAAKDCRIRVHSNDKFVGVIENHNIAFRLMSEVAKYCKVVSADDFLFPGCIQEMVTVAENNPSVGIVGSYQLSGSNIRWQGFQYPTVVFPGREVGRQVFLTTKPEFPGFGTPTSTIYRAELVKETAEFYPNSSPHADTSACFKSLQKWDYGFVYQVLSYERRHDRTQSSKSAEMNRYSSATLNDLTEYGAWYLNKDELKDCIDRAMREYHRFLAVNYIIGFRGTEFWNYHNARLKELGYPLSRFTLLKAAVVKVLQEIVNPEQAIRKVWKRVFSGSTGSAGQSVRRGAGEDETLTMLNTAEGRESRDEPRE